jgi:hypothetical protein
VLLCIARDPAGRCSSGRVTVDGYPGDRIAAVRRISISPAVIGRHRDASPALFAARGSRPHRLRAEKNRDPAGRWVLTDRRESR